jgi:hypothetical protein
MHCAIDDTERQGVSGGCWFLIITVVVVRIYAQGCLTISAIVGLTNHQLLIVIEEQNETALGNNPRKQQSGKPYHSAPREHGHFHPLQKVV